MRTLRVAAAALRWIFDFSRIVRLTRLVAGFTVCTAMICGASVMTVALNFPEDSLYPLWTEPEVFPLSAYAHWSEATDDDDVEAWIACIGDPDCVDRVCSIDAEREEVQAGIAEPAAGIH
jgi:hypothetical protein